MLFVACLLSAHLVGLDGVRLWMLLPCSMGLDRVLIILYIARLFRLKAKKNHS
jgi:hypothetical protein